MRSRLRLLSCLALLALPVTAQTATRSTLPLEAWRFQPGVTPDMAPAADQWADMTLPYLWTETWKHNDDRKGKAWEKTDFKDLNSAWFETTVTVPAEFAGRRIQLSLAGVQCDAILFVGDRKLGELKGPDGRFDLTGVVQPGQPTTLRLWVTKWWIGTVNQRQDDLLRDVTLQGRAKTQWYHNDEEVRRAVPGGIAEPAALLAEPLPAALDNVRVETSYRERQLRVHLQTAVHEAVPGATLHCQVAELDGRTVGLPACEAPLSATAPADEPVAQTLTTPWTNPHCWDVLAPYLYQLQVSLRSADGKVLDQYPPVRFGFREIWTEGKELMLNGHRLRLRMPYFVQNLPEMIFFEGMGFNTIEFQPNPSAWYGTWGLFAMPNTTQSGTRLLDAADERGWAVLMPAPGVSEVRDLILKPEAQRLYLNDFQTWLRAADRQNRPSILMWVPSMNTGGFYDPEKLGRAPTGTPQPWYAGVEKLLKSQDSTRLVFHHQGGQTGDLQLVNCYLNFIPLQEREEYVSAWSKSAEFPWGAVEHGPPAVVNFFKHKTVPYFTEYAAMYLGDQAYDAERDPYIEASLETVAIKNPTSAFTGNSAFGKNGQLHRMGSTTAYDDFMDLYLRHTNRAWRGYGVNGGWFPWLFDVGFGAPEGAQPAKNGWWTYEFLQGTDEELKARPAWASPLYDAFRDTMQPRLVFLSGPAAHFTAKDHDYFAGEAFEQSITAVFDGPGNSDFTVDWVLSSGGNQVAKGVETFQLKAGDIEHRPLPLTAPNVTERTDGKLAMSIRGTKLGDELPLTFFPRVKPPATKVTWGLYDPLRQTAATLARYGVKPKLVESRADLKGVDALAVGYRALSRAGKMPFTPADVERGLRVVLFEQDVDSLEAMGFRVQDVIPRYVFERVPEHPILAGLQPSDLVNWRGAGELLPTTSAGMKVWPWPHGPHWQNTNSVASVILETPHRGAFTPLLECEFDLAYSPLLTWRHGRGEVVFCQLDVTGRDQLEPAAATVVRNLVSYLGQPAPPQDKALQRVGDGVLGELGFAPPDAAPQATVTVVEAGAWPNSSQVLREVVKAGGTVFVGPQSADLWVSPNAPFQAKLGTVKLSSVKLEQFGQSPLLTGIGPSLLHFRTFLDLTPFTELPAGATKLLDGLLVEVPEGNGRWVCCQLDGRKLNDGSDHLRRPRWNERRLYRQLLTNLGAQTDPATAEQLYSPRQFAPMRDVTLWQVWQQAPEIDPQGGPNNSLPALGGTLPAEAWVAKPDPATAKQFVWRLRGEDKNGYLDLTSVAPAKTGQVGYAVTHVYSSAARQATLTLGADWWLVFKVNGQPVVNHAVDGRTPHAPKAGEWQLSVPLVKGWNRFEAQVASGSGGFGLWCKLSDPGDLRVSPTLTAPANTPAISSSAPELLKEPLLVGRDLLYAEPLLKEDDPYGFTPW